MPRDHQQPRRPGAHQRAAGNPLSRRGHRRPSQDRPCGAAGPTPTASPDPNLITDPNTNPAINPRSSPTTEPDPYASPNLKLTFLTGACDQLV